MHADASSLARAYGTLARVQYELLVGLRYTRAKRRNHFISFISLTSMLGIALGVAALIVVLSVMNGFQKELRARILGVASHVQISGAGRPARRLAGGGDASRGATRGCWRPRPTSTRRAMLSFERRRARRGGARHRCRSARTRSPTSAAT